MQPAEHLAFGQLPGQLLQPPPALVLIDGVTAALSLLGLNVNDNSDVAVFFATLPRPLAQAGAAVVMIDHLSKASEGRGRYAIGAQHKLAALDGAAFVVTPVQPFGHGRHGISRIEVVKDRVGRVREYAAGNRVGDLHLRSEGGQVRAEIRPPEGGSGDGWRPTVFMGKISNLLAESDEPLGTREILTAIGGKKDYVQRALNHLVEEGYVSPADGPRGSKLHTLVRPFVDRSRG